MPPMLVAACWFLGAYLLGSVPFGLWIGLTKGVDVRTRGSGNIGATNVGRVLGHQFGLLVFALDLLKGFIPVMLAGRFLLSSGAAWDIETAGDLGYLIWVAVAAGAMLGHMFSLFLRFRGGKGVSTALGVLLAIYPYFTLPGLIAFALWAVVTKAVGIVSVGSISAAVAFPVLFAVAARVAGWGGIEELWPMYLFAVVLAALVVFRHRDNIQILLGRRQPRSESSGQAPT